MAGNRWRIGKVTVTRIDEIEAGEIMQIVLPDATPERLLAMGWLRPHFIHGDGRMKGSIHAFVVETPDRRIMVDSCVGNDKVRERPQFHRLQTRFLDDLAAAGYPVDSIDTVMCTHLHTDHVGWNTRLVDGKWVPTFPKARYLMEAAEYRFWEATERPGPRQVFADSVRPVAEAGLVDLVSSEHRLCPEVSLVPSPGHTPGHVSVLIESEGETGLISGDFLHHPCQMAHPEWCAIVDEEPELAHKTRRGVLDRFADGPALFIGTHFAAPTAGRIRRDGDAFRLDV